MELPVLAPPARGEGCISRYVETVDLGGELGRVQVIVSGCQMNRYVSGIDSKLAEVRSLGLGRDETQNVLQSWIDGGSPCDMPYAQPADRLSIEQAMAAEMAFYAQRTNGMPPPGMERMPYLLIEIREGPPGMFGSPFPRRRRGLPLFLMIYMILALTYLVIQAVRHFL